MAKFSIDDIKKALADPKRRNPLIWFVVGVLVFLTIIFTISSGGEKEPVETPVETNFNLPDSVPMALADEPGNDIDLIQQRLKEEEDAARREAEEQAKRRSNPDYQDNASDRQSSQSQQPPQDPVAAALEQRFAQAAEAQRQAAEPSKPAGSPTELTADQKYRLEMYRMGLDPDTGRPLSESAQADSAATEEPAQEAPKAVRRSGGVSSLRDQSKTGVTDMNGDDEFIYEDGTKPIKVMFAKDGKVRSGERVTLRLLEDLLVDGLLIPANTHLFATCSIGQRFDITVASIDINGKIYTLNYEAYDNDGLKGLYYPSTQSSEQGKRAIDEAGQIAQTAVSSSLTGISGQVARSGITLARGNKSDKVEVTAGYTFYIVRKESGGSR